MAIRNLQGPRALMLAATRQPKQWEVRSMDDLYWYTVQLRFNSRGCGGNQIHLANVEAASVQDAIDKATSEALRKPEHGQAIYVHGATVDEMRKAPND